MTASSAGVGLHRDAVRPPSPAADCSWLRYRLLGELAAPGDDGCVPSSRQQRALLAHLLLEAGRVVSTERLIAALWHDDPPRGAVGSLHALVSKLRRVLERPAGPGDVLLRRRNGYLLELDPADLDVWHFDDRAQAAQRALGLRDWDGALRSCAAALALWRGPLLAEFADEPWVEVRSVALAEGRIAVLDGAITAGLATGATAAALQQAQALCVEQPTSERACWLLMLALHRSGRSGDAVAAYRRHVRHLDEELGVTAGPVLRELMGAVLRQEPLLHEWPAPTPGNAGRRLAA